MGCRFKEVLIEIKPSGVDGVGAFSVAKIKKGRQIAEGIHIEDYRNLLNWATLGQCDNSVRRKVLSFCVGTPEGFIPPEGLDFNLLSNDWYMNHSCDGNVGFNKKGDFVAKRDIKKGDELAYDYGLAESNPKFRMLCNCRSKKCRGIITGNDWKDKKFRLANLSHMLPRLRRSKA